GRRRVRLGISRDGGGLDQGTDRTGGAVRGAGGLARAVSGRRGRAGRRARTPAPAPTGACPGGAAAGGRQQRTRWLPRDAAGFDESVGHSACRMSGHDRAPSAPVISPPVIPSPALPPTARSTLPLGPP